MSAPATTAAAIDPAAAATLQRAAAALGLSPTPAQIDAMLGYLALLARWNAIYNLTAVREPAAMVTQHLVDCLAAVAALERKGAAGIVPAGKAGEADERGVRILDAGSGGGLPGVLLAILRHEWSVTCVDAVGKKAAFVRQVAGELRLANLTATHARLGAWRGGPFDVVTARAFASLADLVRLTESLLAPGGCWMAMKGQVPDDEIAALPAAIEVFHVEHLQVPGLDAQRCIVWMRRAASPVSSDWPAPPAAPAPPASPAPPA